MAKCVKITIIAGQVDQKLVQDPKSISLNRLNFSDLEIEIFCARYDKDGDFQFNLDEINAIEQGLGEQIANYDHLILEHEKNKPEFDDVLSKSQAKKMSKKQFAEWVKKFIINSSEF